MKTTLKNLQINTDFQNYEVLKMENIKIENAQISHLQFAKDLLEEFKLPFEDIEKHFENFLIAKINNTAIGLIGMEKYSHIALLRSFAIKKEFQNSGTGKMLLDALKQLAKDSGISEFYLLTTTADRYFAKNGFSRLSRENLPPEIQNTEEFKGLCPASAICMKHSLN